MSLKNYYVNKRAQSNGDHEVHVENCKYMPTEAKALGQHKDCDSAVKEAKKTYITANGCKTCCESCHTK